MNRGEKWFSEKQKISIQVFLDTYLLYRELPLSSSDFQGRGNLESKIVYRRLVANFENRLIMIRVAWNMNKGSFQKNF